MGPVLPPRAVSPQRLSCDTSPPGVTAWLGYSTHRTSYSLLHIADLLSIRFLLANPVSDDRALRDL
jgi:hypothetical protein